MIRRPVFLALAPVALAVVPSVQAQFENFNDLTNLGDEIRILGEGIQFDPDSDEVTYSGSVDITYGTTRILANRARYDTVRRVVQVEGNVTIYQGQFVYRGQDATFNLATNHLSSNSLRTYVATPNGLVFADAGQFNIDTNDTSRIVTHDSFVTAHDNPIPNWRVEADEIEIYPEDRMVFHDMVFRIRDTPVFWLPYYSQPFDSELGYQFTPGWDSDWGAFLLNRYGVMAGPDDNALVQYRLDGRSERGLAGGADIYSSRWRSEPNFGRLFLYYANDADPFISGNVVGREDAGLETNRYRVNLQHRIYLKGYNDTWDVDPDTGESRLVRRGEPVDPNLYLDADLNLVSDEFFYEDFFPAESRTDPQPDSLLNLVQRDSRYEASLLARLRLNDAFQRDQRLEPALDVVRQPLNQFGLLYQSSSTLGHLSEELSAGEDSRLRRQRDLTQQWIDVAELAGLPVDPALRNQVAALGAQLDSQSFLRADTYHQLTRPTMVGDVFSLVPRAGVRATSYNGVETGDDEVRLLGHVGMESSVKFSRTWDGVQNRSLGLDGLMHVIRPYNDLSVVAGDQLGNGFRPIDNLPLSTRARALDLAQFTAVDEINEWQVARLGLQNLLLTKRDQQTHQWLSYNTFIDFYAQDPEHDRTVSNWFHEIEWRPLPWLNATFDGQLPTADDDQGFTEWNSRLGWMPRDWVEFGIGNRYLQDHPFFEDSNLVTLDGYVRLNEDWALSGLQAYESDDGTMEYQQYGIHRDLETWTTALTLLMRDEREETAVGVMFNVTLKQFPQLNLPLSVTPGGGGGSGGGAFGN